MPPAKIHLLNITCAAVTNCCLDIDSSSLFFLPSETLRPFFSHCDNTSNSIEIRAKNGSCPSLLSFLNGVYLLETIRLASILIDYITVPNNWLSTSLLSCPPDEILSIFCQPDPRAELKSFQTKIVQELAETAVNEKIYTSRIQNWKYVLKKISV
jgi:hypothetical protein